MRMSRERRDVRCAGPCVWERAIYASDRDPLSTLIVLYSCAVGGNV